MLQQRKLIKKKNQKNKRKLNIKENVAENEK